MRLDFLLLADAAEVGEAGKVSILGGGITRITPPGLPFVLPRISAVIRFVLESADFGTRHEVRLRLTEPGGKQIGSEMASLFAVEQKQKAHAGEEEALVIVADMSLIRLEKQGQYLLELFLDQKRVARKTLAVQVG
jgi:hypothetical protein